MLLELILFSVISALFVSLVILFIRAKGEVPAPKPKVETPKAPKPKKVQPKKVEQPVTKTQPRKAVQEKEEVPSEDEFDIEDVNEEDSVSGMNGFGVLTTKKAKKVEEVKPKEKPKAKEAEKPKEKPKQEKAAEKPKEKPKAKEAEKPKAKEAEKPKAKEAEKPKAKEAEKPKAAEKPAPKAAEGKPKKESEQKKPKEVAEEKKVEEVPVEKKKREYKGDFVMTPYKTEEEFWNATFERPQKPEVKEEQKPEKKEKKNQEKKTVIVEKKGKNQKNVQKNEATINNVGNMGWINEETGAEESNTQIEGYFPTLDSAQDKVNTKKRQPEQAFEIEMQAPADKVRKTEAKAEESSPASLETKQ